MSSNQVSGTLDVSLTPLRGYTPDYTLKISGATFHKDYCFSCLELKLHIFQRI